MKINILILPFYPEFFLTKSGGKWKRNFIVNIVEARLRKSICPWILIGA